jgi:hypothetical protein
VRSVLDVVVSMFRYSPEMRMIEIGAFFLVWIAGMVYCERVADEQRWNEWLARGAGIFLPVIGPVIYWLLRREARKHRHYSHKPRVL